MIPNTSKYVRSPTQYIPLISRIPARTLSRRLGVRPSWPKTEAIARRVGRAPVEVGFFHFLLWILAMPAATPFIPAKGVAFIAEALARQASKDLDAKGELEQERLSLKMELEMGEIDEVYFKKRIGEIDRRLEQIKGLSA